MRAAQDAGGRASRPGAPLWSCGAAGPQSRPLQGENIGALSPRTLFSTLPVSLAKRDIAQYRHHLGDIISVRGGGAASEG